MTNYSINFNNPGAYSILNIDMPDSGNHYYCVPNNARTGVISLVSLEIMNYYFKNGSLDTKGIKTDKRKFTINDHNSDGEIIRKSISFNYSDIIQSIKENGFFSPSLFNLPQMECYWLDKSIDMSINFHRFDNEHRNALIMTDGTPQQQYGPSYPIKPLLDREGHIITSFQNQLMYRVIKQRSDLIKNSDKALTIEWILDLRSLVNDSISILDITLNQLYIKAQFDPQKLWKFDKEILGEKHGRRIIDKLKWVRQISSSNLNIEKEMLGLDNLRKIRNHFNHFDPPSFAITIEEACLWLNQVIDIGYILFKIRKAINAPCSTLLINFLLQKEVKFVSESHFSDRLPLENRSGYLSSTWK